MWLPKDERKLLAGYYQLIGDVGKRKKHETWDLVKAFAGEKAWKDIVEYGESTMRPNAELQPKNYDEMIKAVKDLGTNRARFLSAHGRLVERKYVESRSHETVSEILFVELTIDGFDLGRRYSNWWIRTGLWFDEYRNHWVWLIVSFFGGIIGALAVGLVSKWIGH